MFPILYRPFLYMGEQPSREEAHRVSCIEFTDPEMVVFHVLCVCLFVAPWGSIHTHLVEPPAPQAG